MMLDDTAREILRVIQFAARPMTGKEILAAGAFPDEITMHNTLAGMMKHPECPLVRKSVGVVYTYAVIPGVDLGAFVRAASYPPKSMGSEPTVARPAAPPNPTERSDIRGAAALARGDGAKVADQAPEGNAPTSRKFDHAALIEDLKSRRDSVQEQIATITAEIEARRQQCDALVKKYGVFQQCVLVVEEMQAEGAV